MDLKKGEKFDVKTKECGAALAIAVIITAILAIVALTALAFSSTEVRIAGSDLQRTQAFYASASAIEKMTQDFSDLFRTKMRPTAADLDTIKNSPPLELKAEGFDFDQTLEEDAVRLNELRTMQGLPATTYPRVNIPDGPYAGLYASLVPYKLSSKATNKYTKTEVKLEREFNNYLVPLFQFGVFSNEDVEIHPGPLMTFNGRIHSNGNIYALRNTKFLNRLTMAGEFIRDATRGGESNTQSGNSNVWFEINGVNVQSTLSSGSMKSGSGTVGGPNIVSSTSGTRGFYPGSPNGIPNTNWESLSVQSPSTGDVNKFGGQVLTNTTGATQLKMPLELDGSSPAELIKRSLPSDSAILADSRYHAKSQVRILIDDESAGSGVANAAGIPAGKGVTLSTFIPLPLANGNVLRRVDDTTKNYVSTDVLVKQKKGGTISTAMTVRGIRDNNNQKTAAGDHVPSGAGISGRILIEIVKPDGTTVDVTQTILSMGMTEGEPNGIVYLQRPLWAAFVQGSRDRSGGGFDLTSLTNNYQTIADGEIIDPTNPTSLFDTTRGFIKTSPLTANEDSASGTDIIREDSPSGKFNQIVPINVYNVREGWFRSTMSEFDVYERGMTGVVEINMKNLARWLDGIYDTNLLAGTNAVSANIWGDDGYVVYISDRRGDRVKTEYKKDGTTYSSTNGTVDNEDIYGPNGVLDGGEDVIDTGRDWALGGASKKGTLQKDTFELPDTGNVYAQSMGRQSRAETIMEWKNYDTGNNKARYFRNSVRLFNAERLSFTAAAGKLSPTKGITIASENMVYVWGNYNTTGITGIPSGGSTLNNGGYTGPQVPSSIVCDALFALSKTWFDALSSLYPEGSSDPRNLRGTAYRMADDNLPDITQSTSVRAAIIAGTNASSLTGTPGRDASGLRRNGGIINYPRFLETWNLNSVERSWNYTGSFVPLFRSTQALSNWENDTAVIYMPPRRNWSFDQTFMNPNQLPPGTPFFQYISATGFRQRLRD